MASGLKFIPSFLNVLGLIMILNTAEKDEAIISGIYLCLLLLRYSGVFIYTVLCC